MRTSEIGPASRRTLASDSSLGDGAAAPGPRRPWEHGRSMAAAAERTLQSEPAGHGGLLAMQDVTALTSRLDETMSASRSWMWKRPPNSVAGSSRCCADGDRRGRFGTAAPTSSRCFPRRVTGLDRGFVPISGSGGSLAPRHAVRPWNHRRRSPHIGRSRLTRAYRRLRSPRGEPTGKMRWDSLQRLAG